MQPLRTIKEIDSYIKNCWICGKYMPLSYHSNRLDDISSATLKFSEGSTRSLSQPSIYIVRDTGFILKEENKALHKKCKTCNFSVVFKVRHHDDNCKYTQKPSYILERVYADYTSKGDTRTHVYIIYCNPSNGVYSYNINVSNKRIEYDMDFSKIKKIKEIVDKVNLYSILE